MAELGRSGAGAEDGSLPSAVCDDLARDAPAGRLGESGLGDLGQGERVCRARHRDARGSAGLRA